MLAVGSFAAGAGRRVINGGFRYKSTVASDKFRQIVAKQLEEIRSAGTYKKERYITTPQNTSIGVQGTQGKVLNFCANNYLGLAGDGEVVNAAKRALDTHGNGLSSVRFICGTQNIHKELEGKIAKFHGREQAILFPSCFDANAGIFEALLTPEDAVISDELNHASIIDGIRLCKARKFKYAHRDLKELEARLVEAKDARVRLIATDGVFSMDGNVAPIKEICDLAEKHEALVFMDECHATGFFGKTGRGTEEHCDAVGRVDMINSTLGKALGGASGGYTTGPAEIVELLRQRARPYLFSNSVPPPVVGSAIKVFDMISASSDLCEKVAQNTRLFRGKMKAAGFRILGDDHPIAPVLIGDAKLATLFADEMLKHGVYVIAFSYPVVARGKDRIRVQLSAAHTTDQVLAAVDAFTSVGRQLGVI
eukprot:Opistho-2@81219